MIELPVDAQDAIISQPNIIDASVLTARRVLVYAKAMGDANVFLLGRDGRKLLILDLSVKQDLADLHGMLQKLLPGSKIKLTASGEGVVLSGSVAHGVDAAGRGDRQPVLKGGKVVNLLTAGAKEQVMLKITVAEFQREAIRRLGVNLPEVDRQSGCCHFRQSGAEWISGQRRYFAAGCIRRTWLAAFVDTGYCAAGDRRLERQ